MCKNLKINTIHVFRFDEKICSNKYDMLLKYHASICHKGSQNKFFQILLVKSLMTSMI